MDDMRFSLFGNLQIEFGSQHRIEMSSVGRKNCSVTCCFSDRLHEREKLATLMWGDKSPGRSKQHLRQTLWQLQSSLNGVVQRHHLLVAEHERIGIDPHATYWLDVAVFDQAYSSVEKIPGSALSAQQVDALQASLQLYQGDLLEGCYEDWCIYERERRQTRYLGILEKLLAYSETHHAYEAGAAYGRQILHCDRAHERTHRHLMRLHYLAGNRTAALQQYAACVAALAEELDVAPAQSTVALYEQICSDQVHDPVPGVPEAQPHPEHLAVLPTGLHQQLDQIQSTLTQLQTQLTHFILALGRDFGDHP